LEHRNYYFILIRSLEVYRPFRCHLTASEIDKKKDKFNNYSTIIISFNTGNLFILNKATDMNNIINETETNVQYFNN